MTAFWAQLARSLPEAGHDIYQAAHAIVAHLYARLLPEPDFGRTGWIGCGLSAEESCGELADYAGMIGALPLHDLMRSTVTHAASPQQVRGVRRLVHRRSRDLRAADLACLGFWMRFTRAAP